MGISDVAENALLDLIFTAVTWADIAEDHVASPITNIAYALHTAALIDANPQDTSETAYTSYARKDVARTTGGHTVTTNSVSPFADIDFVAGTGGGDTVNNFSVGKTNTGSTDVFFSGSVAPTIATGDGVTPRLTTATTITLD